MSPIRPCSRSTSSLFTSRKSFLDATKHLALIVPTRSLVERNGMHASGELRFDRYRRKTCDFTLAAITGDVAAYLDLTDAKHLHSAQAFSEQRL